VADDHKIFSHHTFSSKETLARLSRFIPSTTRVSLGSLGIIGALLAAVCYLWYAVGVTPAGLVDEPALFRMTLGMSALLFGILLIALANEKLTPAARGVTVLCALAGGLLFVLPMLFG
jgi:hypothetical protein